MGYENTKKYLAIEAWSDGIYQDLEHDYAMELIKDHGITKEIVKDYKGLSSSQAYNDCPIEQSLLETLEGILTEGTYAYVIAQKKNRKEEEVKCG